MLEVKLLWAVRIQEKKAETRTEKARKIASTWAAKAIALSYCVTE